MVITLRTLLFKHDKRGRCVNKPLSYSANVIIWDHQGRGGIIISREMDEAENMRLDNVMHFHDQGTESVVTNVFKSYKMRMTYLDQL